MSQAKGTVKEIYPKSWKDKTFYSIRLNGDSNYYNTGEAHPGSIDGEYISFDYQTNAKGFLEADIKSIKVLDKSEVKQEIKVAKVAKGGISKDEYWTRREERDVDTQKRIELQSCRNSAIELLSVMLAAGAIKLPAAQAAKEESMQAILSKYISDFVLANSGRVPTNEESSTEEVKADTNNDDEWS